MAFGVIANDNQMQVLPQDPPIHRLEKWVDLEHQSTI
jgi:hypothetical protein